MAKTTTLNVRVTPEVKWGAERVLSQLGIPMSTAIEMYLKQIAMTGGIPFSVTLPEDFEELNVEEMGKSVDDPYIVDSEATLLEAFQSSKKFILIKGEYEQEVKDLIKPQIPESAKIGVELALQGGGDMAAEILYQISNAFGKGDKVRNKLEHKMRGYNMKRNADGEMVLYWRQLDY